MNNINKEEIINEIKRLQKEKNAIILVHNYQKKEVQEIADILGDSLDLSKKAKETNADIIVFAGVRFMAETAKILSSDKKVLLPVKDAGCPMADMITKKNLIKMKEKYPDYKVVAYVNTSAEVKSEVDICCTSANAINLIKNYPYDKILFVPDKNLGSYIKKHVKDKDIILWEGFCPVHHNTKKEDILAIKEEHPDAIILVHPECPPEVLEIADYALSTNQMVKFVKESNYKEFIIGTEEGMIYRLERENPDKKFYNPKRKLICQNMKKTSLIDIYNALKFEQYEINLSQEIIEKSKNALEEMLKYT